MDGEQEVKDEPQQDRTHCLSRKSKEIRDNDLRNMNVDVQILPVQSVRDRSIDLNSFLSFMKNINLVTKNSNYHIRSL